MRKSAPTLPALAGLRVLIVEDEEDSRELLMEFLRGEGADVEMAADAGHGFAALLDFKPALLLSDIGLPDEDGYALMRRCRALPEQELAHVPAIAVTAYCRPEDKAKSLAAGFDEHLCKPIDFGKLVSSILRLTKAQQGSAEPRSRFDASRERN